jgi:hypothetical protein
MIAIHALGKQETARLLLADLDLPAAPGDCSPALTAGTTPSTSTSSPTLSPSNGRVNDTVSGPSPPPPRLLDSQVIAADKKRPPVAHTVMEAIFEPLGLSPGKLRQDRILDEASHTADPSEVRLPQHHSHAGSWSAGAQRAQSRSWVGSRTRQPAVA